MKCGETRGGMWEEEEKDKTPKRGYLETLWWEGKGRPWIGCLEIFVQICQWYSSLPTWSWAGQQDIFKIIEVIEN